MPQYLKVLKDLGRVNVRTEAGEPGFTIIVDEYSATAKPKRGEPKPFSRDAREAATAEVRRIDHEATVSRQHGRSDQCPCDECRSAASELYQLRMAQQSLESQYLSARQRHVMGWDLTKAQSWARPYGRKDTWKTRVAAMDRHDYRREVYPSYATPLGSYDKARNFQIAWRLAKGKEPRVSPGIYRRALEENAAKLAAFTAPWLQAQAVQPLAAD